MNNHCCERMTYFLADIRIPLDYSTKFREYVLVMPQAFQMIDYCPWCGKELPTSLRDEWYEILENLLGEVIYELDYTDERIPEEFRDDTWWIKRN